MLHKCTKSGLRRYKNWKIFPGDKPPDPHLAHNAGVGGGETGFYVDSDKFRGETIFPPLTKGPTLLVPRAPKSVKTALVVWLNGITAYEYW